MPRTAPSIPHVAEWVATLTPSKTSYAHSVRTFFSKRGDFDASSVGREELVHHCMAVESTAHSRTCTALDAFFTYLDDEKLIPKHPAPRLANRVSKALKLRERERRLLEAGMAALAVASLRWSDVVLEMAEPAGRLPTSMQNETRDSLFDDALLLLKGASSQTVRDVLNAKVLS
jgi:hypothetical protein